MPMYSVSTELLVIGNGHVPFSVQQDNVIEKVGYCIVATEHQHALFLDWVWQTSMTGTFQKLRSFPTHRISALVGLPMRSQGGSPLGGTENAIKR